ncbi:Hypothetical predicted protein [Pelobates cultripes]|uniref:Uncharacterized protein n=1 Tax=Pelobates cultripes TaxID=61616 RepID=A0AAD1WQN7_PELCU|nr:Hypothetical predicted protein [Pelobates cultripes]
MRLSSIISFIIIVNCLNTFQSVFGKNEKSASKRGEKQSFARSGQFSTKQKHECTWEISGDLMVNLSLSCKDQANINYKCTYEGEPQKCHAYNAKANQYWKQILGKFKKLKNACEENTLKSRICKKAAEVESHLKKISGDVADGMEQGNKRMGQSKGSRKGSRTNLPEVNGNVGAEKKSNDKKKKTDKKLNDKADPTSPSAISDLLPTAGIVNDDMELNEDLAEAHCAENWQSVCSFFVNFWNG